LKQQTALQNNCQISVQMKVKNVHGMWSFTIM